MLTKIAERQTRDNLRPLCSKTEFPPAQKGRAGAKSAEPSRLEPDSWNPLDEVVSFYDYPLASAVGTNIKGWFDTCFWLSSCIRFLFYSIVITY